MKTLSAYVGLKIAEGVEPRWFWYWAERTIDTIFFFDPNRCLVHAAHYSDDPKDSDPEPVFIDLIFSDYDSARYTASPSEPKT